MSYNQLIIALHEAFEDLDINAAQLAEDDLSDEDVAFLQEAVGEWEIVYSERDAYKNDRELQDEEVIFHFKKYDIYLGMSGEYSSWEGLNWYDEFYQVKPTEKTIIVYNRVK